MIVFCLVFFFCFLLFSPYCKGKKQIEVVVPLKSVIQQTHIVIDIISILTNTIEDYFNDSPY